MSYYDSFCDVSVLVGKTLVSVINVDDGELQFTTDSGEKYILYHEQDCCENVYIEDINGDLSDLVGSPITMAEQVDGETVGHSGGEVDEYDDSYTWTYYKFATVKGYVDVRWYGSSNGYYSERVDFRKVN